MLGTGSGILAIAAKLQGAGCSVATDNDPVAVQVARHGLAGRLRRVHRVLAENDEVRERCDQLTHPKYTAPELLATKPNELWSWDITKLHGPAKWTYFYLYVILDVFSRYIIGWMIAPRETAVLAEKLISETCERQGITSAQLTIHADRGSPMKSKAVAFLLADLGVAKSHSRPHVSNDNPF